MTSFHAHPDWQALLRTICEHPGADLPRLVAADWLEADAPTPCPEYAEFIRAGCEAFGLDIHDPRYTPARAWEQELWMAGETWRQEIRRTTGVEIVLHQDVNEGPMPSGPYMVAAGGFGRAIHAPLAWLIGGECERCAGTGIYTDNEIECAACSGTGRTPAHLDELVRCQPVTRVVVTELVPFEADGGFRWYFNGPIGDEEGLFPLDVWHHLEAWPGAAFSKTFPTREAAADALSLALLNPVRERAGLPALHPAATLEVVR